MQGSVILGLGSNLGVREDNIRQAILMIQNYGEVTHQSNLYETSSWG
ncbi:MAG TPA: 2-amino-4-hydroxy-6-hydroxymethyldihydropteridine diphosphokinase, partial [Flavobacteriales bacterium]|nr:2-amino-4-hydroxy-6-hydroxymethyldihydropteridine diphosphokinase [Flavobacteriales bacterium]